MLKFGNKEFRNLEEQVLQNQADIQYILQEEGVLNQFGIKVVGKVDNANQLPDQNTYVGEYGDAYAVGRTTPYDLYIWTRNFSGAGNPFWFNIGKFPVEGPEGERGPQGRQGEDGQRGSRWESKQGYPNTYFDTIADDQSLDTSTGDVYQYNGAAWVLRGNIRGPQGIQGIQGIQGPVGPVGPQGIQGPRGATGQILEIIGKLENTDQLPDPSSVANTDAYLIPDSEGKNHIWAVVGGLWTDVGVAGLQGEPGVSVQDVQLIPTGEIADIVGPMGPTGPAGPPGKDGTQVDLSDYATKEYVNDAEDTLQAQIDSIDGEIPKKLEVGNIQAGENILLNVNGNDITISAEGSGTIPDNVVTSRTSGAYTFLDFSKDDTRYSNVPLRCTFNVPGDVVPVGTNAMIYTNPFPEGNNTPAVNPSSQYPAYPNMSDRDRYQFLLAGSNNYGGVLSLKNQVKVTTDSPLTNRCTTYTPESITMKLNYNQSTDNSYNGLSTFQYYFPTLIEGKQVLLSTKSLIAGYGIQIDEQKKVNFSNSGYGIEISLAGEILPTVTEADNGKILKVVDGKWAVVDA